MRKDILRYETRREISKGNIKVPDACEDCGAVTKLDCHHREYNDPFDVVFLCTNCHEKRHTRGGIEIVTVPQATCDKCGHVWTPRVVKPVACPRCKRSDWEPKPKPEPKKEKED